MSAYDVRPTKAATTHHPSEYNRRRADFTFQMFETEPHRELFELVKYLATLKEKIKEFSAHLNATERSALAQINNTNELTKGKMGLCEDHKTLKLLRVV